jgi:predicted RNA-binding Zn-ribbon protein involved in translation (DUF1610 family)
MADKVFNANVKCDESGCGWKLDNVNIYDWYNVLCPKCGKCIIINDKDIEFAEPMELLVNAGVYKNVTGEEEKHPVRIFADSAFLRKKE